MTDSINQNLVNLSYIYNCRINNCIYYFIIWIWNSCSNKSLLLFTCGIVQLIFIFLVNDNIKILLKRFGIGRA